MKKFLLAIILLTTLSCKKEETNSTAVTSSASTTLGSTTTAKDDFSDLTEEKDESCGTEKDIEKEIMEASKKKDKEVKLGGTTDCTIQ